MAQLRTSDNLVRIGTDKTSTLSLSTTSPPLAPPSPQALFYKIKTNHPDLLDVKPTFGVLPTSDSPRSTANIHIRYKGTSQEIVKTRLQINWIKIESSDAANLNRKKIAELAEMYRQLKERKGAKEESILLPFCEEEEKKEENCEEKREEFRYRGTDQSLEEPRKIKQEILSSFKKTQHQEHPSQTSETSATPPSTPFQSISFSQLLLFLLFSFLFGLLIGIKLQKLNLFQPSIPLSPSREEL